MAEVGKRTITTLEVAEMMEVEHWELLRKLEGRVRKDGSHIKGYVEILTDNHLVVSDFFILSSYQDFNGKENKCYEVTKTGCDFLANKSTGEKGILFTARYVKRFYEMENQIKQRTFTEHPGEVANMIKVLVNIMNRQGSFPYKVAEIAKGICEQYGIQLPKDFVKIPVYEQLSFDVAVK